MQFISKLINLFKIFFPSWKFFDDSTLWPVLEYQINDGAWTRFDERPAVKPVNILLNAENLILLNFQTHIQKSLMNLKHLTEQEIEKYDHTADFLLLSNFIKHFIKKKYSDLNEFNYQFKICLDNELVIKSSQIHVGVK